MNPISLIYIRKTKSKKLINFPLKFLATIENRNNVHGSLFHSLTEKYYGCVTL